MGPIHSPHKTTRHPQDTHRAHLLLTSAGFQSALYRTVRQSAVQYVMVHAVRYKAVRLAVVQCGAVLYGAQHKQRNAADNAAQCNPNNTPEDRY